MVNDTAWQTLIGTLGGVAVTAVFGLLTAYFTHRWQQDRFKQENTFALARETRAARRQTYAKYLVSAQNVYDATTAHYVANREHPLDVSAISIDPPEDLYNAVVANEALRIEVMLLAGSSVRDALQAYDATLKGSWPIAAAGVDLTAQRPSTQAYHELIGAMQREILEAD
ncbi:hypothetical protein BKM31_15995 [[Actinomadura] parvosata subsp. kistnae]|uniref:Uncharacterized protein n=1 Tax=[Actinomadura] parvosata subsp. kistnae TaxID=1909395 RepID=A0A1U9ZXS0_9ACTN|nr:hypothetical protein [Nonomuraea sp. ATCC 55076]AQZ62761.1 hypothetical protein BKM31_15995 [Nonomuraea sp. ATCC 55076]